MPSGYAIVTLVAFILSILFAAHPLSIRLPRPLPCISINLTTAPILAIAILWAAQCIDATVIRNGIVGTEGVKPYNILILFFSLAYMAITLDITGVLQATAFWVSNKSAHNGRKLYLHFYFMFTLVSIFFGGSPAILSGAAFLVDYVRIANLDPRAWVIAEFAATNTANMVLFVANPMNVVICEGFGVNNAVFTVYTILPFLICHLFCFAALVFQFRKQIPRNLTIVYRDPWTALRDPIGALVGSVMLGVTLILCLIVSFFGIDVWMVSLPFAIAKFMFDLGWDFYRYSRGKLTAEDHDEAPQTWRHSRSRHSMSPPSDVEQSQLTVFGSHSDVPKVPPVSHVDNKNIFGQRFPTLIIALPRLPYTLVLFAFSQFILIEALGHQGWLHIFGDWFARASHKGVYSTIWLIGVLGIILCNICGTNIGTTILLTKVVRATTLSHDANRAAAIALAVASNIGPINFAFSASLAGLRWRALLDEKDVRMKQQEFAFWNMLPLLVMTTVGLGIVSAEMAILS